MKAYILLTEGFEEVEALTTADILIRAGIDVKLVKLPIDADDIKNSFACGSHNIKVVPDLTLGKDVSIEELMDGDCVILPGGMPGTKNLSANSSCTTLIKAYFSADKKVAAICAAPSVLGENGLLNGKTATCFPGNEEKLLGASVVPDGAVIDENIITGKSMGSAVTFGLKVTEALLGKKTADKIEASIYRG